MATNTFLSIINLSVNRLHALNQRQRGKNGFKNETLKQQQQKPRLIYMLPIRDAFQIYKTPTD